MQSCGLASPMAPLLPACGMPFKHPKGCYYETPCEHPHPQHHKQNTTMLRPMSLMRRSLHYAFVGRWSQSGLVRGWECSRGL